jgi:hypothetical protein
MAENPKFHLLPLCEEKERLRTLYKASNERFSSAVNDLIAMRGKTTEEEYHRVRSLLTEARNVRDGARHELEQPSRNTAAESATRDSLSIRH